MSALATLRFKDRDVRFHDDDAHVRWLCARDVSRCLGITGTGSHRAALDALDGEQRDTIEVDAGDQQSSMTFVTLGGAMKMALDRPGATRQPFTDWVIDVASVAPEAIHFNVATSLRLTIDFKDWEEDAPPEGALLIVLGLYGGPRITVNFSYQSAPEFGPDAFNYWVNGDLQHEPGEPPDYWAPMPDLGEFYE